MNSTYRTAPVLDPSMDDDCPLPTVAPLPGSSIHWTVGVGLIVAGLAALSLDMPVAHWFDHRSLPDASDKVLRFSEIFGHGVGVVMLLAAVLVLDPLGRPALLRIAVAAFGSGLVANLGKLLVARTRPRNFDLSRSAIESFTQWLPMLSLERSQQSFPSSHTATAVGFAVALTWRFPRGRWLFVALTVLVALQRLSGNSHFVSDIFFGAAVGYLFAHACLPGGIFSRMFDRIEEGMRTAERAAKRQSSAKSDWN